MDARRRSVCEKVDILGTSGCLTVWASGWEVGQSQIIPEPQVPNSLANSFLQQVMGAFFFFSLAAPRGTWDPFSTLYYQADS